MKSDAVCTSCTPAGKQFVCVQNTKIRIIYTYYSGSSVGICTEGGLKSNTVYIKLGAPDVGVFRLDRAVAGSASTAAHPNWAHPPAPLLLLIHSPAPPGEDILVHEIKYPLPPLTEHIPKNPNRAPRATDSTHKASIPK